MKPGPKPTPPLDRVLARVEVGLCWTWQGKPNKKGYGRVTVAPKQWEYVHRLVYLALVGEIPDETLDHLCLNTLCVNPDHLEPVSREEHARRQQRHGTWMSRRATCVNGHEFTPTNTRLRTGRNGRQFRVCLTCQALNNSRAYARRKGTSNAC
jgi:hypothetical protein